jgi:hypothetical protein
MVRADDGVRALQLDHQKRNASLRARQGNQSLFLFLAMADTSARAGSGCASRLPAGGRTCTAGRRGELIGPGGQPRALLEGTVLEAVYDPGDDYLIVSTDGDAFEECMHLALCDASFAPRDVIHIGGAYQTGRFRALQVGPGLHLRFSFFSDEAWRLTVLLAPRWRLRRPRSFVRHSPAFRPGRLWHVREASNKYQVKAASIHADSLGPHPTMGDRDRQRRCGRPSP